MSYSTTQAFITTSEGWESLRRHPALAFMEKFTHAWDAREIDQSTWHEWQTDDYHYQNPKGEVYIGAAANAAATEVYHYFTSHIHEPFGPCCCWETPDGWELLGQATLFADLPVPGPPKSKKDLTGRLWDFALPGMFHFECVKVSGAKYGGIKLKANRTYSDSASTMVEMMKRGMITPDQLG